MASFFSTLSNIRGAEGSGPINGLNASASITNCSSGILKFLIHSECKVSPFHIFIHQESVLHGAIHHLLLFLTVLSRKRGMFMRRRDGVILFFSLAFSCILKSSAAFNNKRHNEADHKRKRGTSCMFHINIQADLKSRTGLM